ncbi:MAG: corrinoid protein [Clostridia bacterium]|nr:corrinoid protein [Clostridia bacterium]
MSILSDLSEALQKGRLPKIKELTNAALAEGIPAKEILDDGLLAGMSVIGEKFKNNQVYVPEVMMAARCMQAGTDLLKPHLTAGETAQSCGTVVIGTVKGDRHDIGKNLCKLMLEGKGLNVIDLGVNVSAEKFVSEAQKNGAQIICCSALLTTTMPEMKRVVEVADAAGIRDKVKIMIGGAPVTQAYCDTIGADCYTTDAASCADAAVTLAAQIS